jgi:predicted branched-subunit amino acid permease
MAETCSEEHASRRAGLRVGAGLAATCFALALSFGALAHSQGWSPFAIIMFSMLTFSGSAQFAVLTALSGGGGALAAIGSATLMNARYLPMGAAAAGSLRGGRWRRGLEGQAVVDGSWVSAYVGHAKFDRSKLLAATAVQWPAWIAGTALGAYLDLSTRFIDRYGLDTIFPAFFLLLLVNTLRSSARVRPIAAAAALIGAGVVLVAPPGLALVAAAAASLLVLFHRPSVVAL